LTREQELEAEILRLRTTETASAHALDVLRQQLGTDLVPNEHPSDLCLRLSEEIRQLKGYEDEYKCR